MTDGPQPPATPTAGKDFTVYFLVVLYLLAVAWGVRCVNQEQDSPIDFLVPFVGSICSGTWAVFDARRRRHPIPTSLQAWFLLLAALVVPIYVVWSRGWRGVGWLALLVAAWFVVAIVALIVGGLLMHGDEWLRALGV